MKSLKTFLITAILSVICLTGFTTERAEAHAAELILTNYSSGRTIGVQVYPISMIFNGNNKYDLHSRYFTPFYHYNIGRGTGGNTFSVGPNSSVTTINHDGNGATGGNTASVGYGKYKIVVTWNTGQDTCTAEWDFGYSFNTTLFSGDLNIIFQDNNSNPRVNFKWSDGSEEYPISYVNKEIVAWDQQYNTAMVRRLRKKNYGNFIYDNTFGNTYNIFPQDSRRDCGGESQGFIDNRSGIITQNLTIDKNVFTPGLFDLWDSPTEVIVNPNVNLKINPTRILDFTEIIPYNPGDQFLMTVKSQGFLTLYNNAQIIIRNHNKLMIESTGNLILNTGSVIRIKPGGDFCNQGVISGPGIVVYEGGIYTMPCPVQTPDFVISGGANIKLESDAVVEIPDNVNLIFKDKNTSLTMSENSKLLLGKNSKVIFETGSKLNTKDGESIMLSSKTFSNNEKSTVDYTTLRSNLTERITDTPEEDNYGKIFTLKQNIPNAFNPTTKISYQIPNNNFVSLKVFDVAGKEVETVVQDFQTAGNHDVTFDGSRLSSGIYYYKMVSGDYVSIRKMILIK